jgi:Tfp pilus assembly protein PilW
MRRRKDEGRRMKDEGIKTASSARIYSSFILLPSSFPRRGFTAIELILGMLITTLIMGAMAAFCMAMSTAWKSAEKTQAVTLLGNQVVMRVQNEIRNAKLIGACTAGSSDGSATGAALLLWKQDTNGDGYIQGNEVEMIEHDTTNHTLKLYSIGQADGAGTWSYSTVFTAATTPANFKLNRQSTPLASGVYGAVFSTNGTSGTTLNPNFRFALKLMVDDAQSAGVGGEQKLMVQYGTATIRAPLPAPSN